MADDPATREVRDIHELMHLVAPRSDADAQRLILRAYKYAEEKHRGVTRTSGQPYITHPLAVAGSLATLRLDAPTIAAALLHDVIEDSNVTVDQMRAEFGDLIVNCLTMSNRIGHWSDVICLIFLAIVIASRVPATTWPARALWAGSVRRCSSNSAFARMMPS